MAYAQTGRTNPLDPLLGVFQKNKNAGEASAVESKARAAAQTSDTIVAVDVGTAKVCTVVAQRERPGLVRVVAYSVTPSAGVVKGNVTDVSQTEEAIRQSVAVASRKSGVDIRSAHLSITGTHMSFRRRRDRINWAATKGVITRDDLEKIPQTVAYASGEPDRHVIHAITRSYTLDGQSGIHNPIGMHTRRLEVESHVVSAVSSFADNLTQAARRSGLDVASLVFGPVASAEATLSAEEKNEGVALVDIGGGTTDIIIYRAGSVIYTSALPVGGYQFTNDISVAFGATYESAEEAKLKYGETDPLSVDASEEVQLDIEGPGQRRKVPRRDIAQLHKERATELARMVNIKMMEGGIYDSSDFGVVLTGGSSRLPGLAKLFRDNLSSKVRIGSADPKWELPTALLEPDYAASVGMIRWAMKNPSALFNGDLGRETAGRPRSGSESGEGRRFAWARRR